MDIKITIPDRAIWEDEEGNVFNSSGDRYTDLPDDAIAGTSFLESDLVWVIRPKSALSKKAREFPEQLVGQDTINDYVQGDARQYANAKMDGIIYDLDYATSTAKKKAILREYIGDILRRAQNGAEDLISLINDCDVDYAGEIEKEGL